MWVHYTEFVAPTPDGPIYDQGGMCDFSAFEFACTRLDGHTGRHQASGEDRMLAVWVDG